METFVKKIVEINGKMESDTSSYFTDVENIVVRFRSELFDECKKYIEQQLKIFDWDPNLGGNDDDEQGIEEFCWEFMFNAELLGSIFETIKEHFDSKINEKQSKVTKDRKDHWEGVEREIREAQHDWNRNVILEILDQTKQFRE